MNLVNTHSIIIQKYLFFTRHGESYNTSLFLLEKAGKILKKCRSEKHLFLSSNTSDDILSVDAL